MLLLLLYTSFVMLMWRNCQ